MDCSTDTYNKATNMVANKITEAMITLYKLTWDSNALESLMAPSYTGHRIYMLG